MNYLDLETYSTQDIRKTGSYKYAEDCEIMMCAIDDEVRFDNFPTKGKYGVWNVGFESPVLNKPDLQFVDVMQKAAAHGLPLSLDKCGKALKIPEDKQKLKEGKRLVRKFSVPRKPTKNNPDTRWTKDNAPEDWAKFVEYCTYDVIATKTIDALLPDLTPKEQQLSQLDLVINSRGLPIDLPLVKRIKALIDEYNTQQIEVFKQITGLAPSQRDRVLNWCKEQGYPLKGYTAEDLAGALKDHNCPDLVKQVLQIRKDTSLSSLKKYDKLMEATCSDGRIKGTMQFHAAQTGRWGGRLIQPQNLPRGSIDQDLAINAINAGADLELLTFLFDSPTEVFKSCIRGMIYHPDGFTIVDYSGIEARVVQWLVGDEDALQVFREGKDVYKHMSSLIFNVPYDKVTKQQRFTGKQAILGLSYQMGKDTFIRTCAGYGVTIEEELAQHTVDTYRETHKKLKSYWYQIEQQAVKAVATGNLTVAGKIKFKVVGNFLYMKLPSGRKIAYPFPELEKGKFGNDQITYMVINTQGQWVRTTTYGGKLVENATQGIARDILRDAMFKLEDKGYKIVATIHDEVIIEGTYPVEEVAKIMCDLEPYHEGNVIDAEGFVSKRFRKD